MIFAPLSRALSHFKRSSVITSVSYLPVRFFHRTPVTMVEGHQCHRVAHAHRKLLLGHAFVATSPNERFKEGAAAISGQPLTRIEVHGKNLFYFFGEEASPVVVHIHFGMSGAFKTAALPGPEHTPTTRLRIENEKLGVVGLVSAMTLQHGGMDYYLSKAAKLGPDPLREDADPQVVWRSVASSKKSIGLLLMEQSVMAGVGNIYRAEILFKAGVHPEQPGYSLSRAAFDEVWRHSVLLLQRGFQAGSILTVDPQEAKVLGKPWTRRYIYNHKSCGRCGGTIRSWDMAGRTAYACEGCQPLLAAEQLPPARAKALNAAKQAQEFVSHCALEDPSDLPPSKMTLHHLRAALAALALPTAGRKAELAARLAGALGGAPTHTQEEAGRAEGVPTPSPRPRRSRAAAAAPTAAAASRAHAGPAEEGAKQDSVHGDAGGRGGGGAALSPEVYGWEQCKPPAGRVPPAAEAHLRGEAGWPASPEFAGQSAAVDVAPGADVAGEVAAAGVAPGKRRRRGGVVPGTKVLPEMASAEEAAAEKARAGEGRNVEHVALQTDGLAEGGGGPARRKRRERS